MCLHAARQTPDTEALRREISQKLLTEAELIFYFTLTNN